MRLQGLTSIAVFLTQVAGIDERFREVLRLNVVADVASAVGVAEGGAYGARVTKVVSLHKLVKLCRVGGHIVQPYQEGSNEKPWLPFFQTFQFQPSLIPFVEWLLGSAKTTGGKRHERFLPLFPSAPPERTPPS